MQVGETVHQLLDILNAGESALQAGSGGAGGGGSGAEDVGLVLSAVLDPLVGAHRTVLPYCSTVL